MATFRNHRSRIKHPESQMSSLSFKNANLSEYSIFHDNLFSDEDFVLLNFQLGMWYTQYENAQVRQH